jgi:hypothetical protein
LSVIIVVVSIIDFNYQNLVNPKSGKRKTSDPNIPLFLFEDDDVDVVVRNISYYLDDQSVGRVVR